jgi:hypothetical protein
MLQCSVSIATMSKHCSSMCEQRDMSSDSTAVHVALVHIVVAAHCNTKSYMHCGTCAIDINLKAYSLAPYIDDCNYVCN